MPVVAGTMPEGFCFTDWQTLLETIAGQLQVTFPTGYTQIVVSNSEPAAEDQDKIWLYIDENGKPVSFLRYVSGRWIRVLSEVLVGVSEGTGAAYTMTNASPVGSMSDVRLVLLTIHTVNTGAVTLSIDGLPASPIRKVGGVALAAGELAAGTAALLAWDLVNSVFQLLAPTPPIKVEDLRNVFTFRSTAQNLPGSGGIVSIAHGLEFLGTDLRPEFVRVVLRRKTGSGPYNHHSGLVISEGDELDGGSLWSYFRGSENEMFWPCFRAVASDTQIRVHCYYPYGLAFLEGGGFPGAQASVTSLGSIGNASDYEMFVYAMAFNPNQLGSDLDSSTSGGGITPPVITVQPANDSVTAPASAVFSVEAQNADSIVWFFQGIEANGARFTKGSSTIGITTTFTLTVTATDVSENGAEVYAVVQNGGGGTTSSTVTMTVS